MPTYIEKVKENRKQIDQIYKKLVYNPIWKDFASKGECSFLAKFLKNPITDLEGLNTEVKVLSESGVEEHVKQALVKVSKVLPGPNTTVYLQVIDPIYKKYIPNSLLTGGVVAHEYHHSVWISRNFKTINFSLLEYLVLEGLADSFAESVYPDIESPWTDVFGFEKEKDVWYSMKNLLNSRDADLIMKMATGYKDIPFASAYTIGYRIMQEFLKNNPQVTLLEWTDMKAEEILSKSKYEEKFY